MQPTNTYKRYHWHRKDAGNGPAPQPSNNRGPAPSQRHNGGTGTTQEHQAGSRVQHSHAYGPQQSAGPSHGRNRDGSSGPTRGKQTHSGMAPRRESGQPSGSAPRSQNFPDGRHTVRPVPRNNGLGHQPLRALHSPSDRQHSNSGSAPYYQGHNGSTGRRQQDQADSRGEHRHIYHPYHSAGPSHGHKQDGNIGAAHRNQPGSARRHGTGRARGSAPQPGNLTHGRHPGWAVPGRDWLSLLPNTEEPMEVEPPANVDEPMEVDIPWPEQTRDYRGASLLSALGAQKPCRRSVRPAPYLLSHRLHRKH